jgi:hypothetical protein
MNNRRPRFVKSFDLSRDLPRGTVRVRFNQRKRRGTQAKLVGERLILIVTEK